MRRVSILPPQQRKRSDWTSFLYYGGRKIRLNLRNQAWKLSAVNTSIEVASAAEACSAWGLTFFS